MLGTCWYRCQMTRKHQIRDLSDGGRKTRVASGEALAILMLINLNNAYFGKKSLKRARRKISKNIFLSKQQMRSLFESVTSRKFASSSKGLKNLFGPNFFVSTKTLIESGFESRSFHLLSSFTNFLQICTVSP